MSHFVCDMVKERYERLRAELPENKYDVILLLNMEKHPGDFDIPMAVYGVEQLNELDYNPIFETVLPGSCHFPMMAFYKDNPEYHNYWFVEYDVEYTGSWQTLMQDCDENLLDYDFLSCHVEKYDEGKNKNWPWWYRSNDVGVRLEDCVKGFNPICRYSDKALAYIDFYQKKGYSVHSEVLITTCLYHGGFKIGDFGGNWRICPLWV